ncbi:ubiquitin family protein [Toxoplasma gondii ME49]|uniref:Ubiquitin family protein n=3 Tax=Toxoplasma gondii TaxID=5811 RepID=A0A125YIH9_TOXGV|nr:ubiquitin family protein [Toxoplasma gondii ME49]EPT30680.1 ubiquitin family protein [Toxoplasma gondii ME49]ESS31425.1 ubiquitin family protein [Toxoplasma gondii VEG]CEL73415.1 TPA: ubiquitin protein, putative [Toxoplasma gondii VEG]|eukprot:XP_018637606.1 ubiquitin family protein [Toxoplasma gondii ME49]
MEDHSQPRRSSHSEDSLQPRDSSPPSPLASAEDRREATLALTPADGGERNEKRETEREEASEDESKERGNSDTELEIPVTVKLINGQTTHVRVDPAISVDEWKNRLEPIVHIPPQEQRLVASGRVLQGSRCLSSYDITANCIVHLLRNRDAGGAASRSSGVSSAGQSSTRGISSSQIRDLAQTEVHPFGLGEGERDLVQQLMQSPLMQQLTDSPDFLRMVMDSNPQLQQLREQNPELNHLLSDPQIFRQSIQMARNPALLREMMRSTDRAMANIEALPGGFHALMRMYHTIQEPMYAATIDAAAADAGGASEAQRQAYEISRNACEPVEEMPNPWAPQPPSPPSETPASSQQFDRILRRGLFPVNPSSAQSNNLAFAVSPQEPLGFPVARMRVSPPRPVQNSTPAAAERTESSEAPTTRLIFGESDSGPAREAASLSAAGVPGEETGSAPEGRPEGGTADSAQGSSFRVVMDLLRSSLRNTGDMRQFEQINRSAQQGSQPPFSLGTPGLLGMLSPFSVDSSPFAAEFPPGPSNEEGREETNSLVQLSQDAETSGATALASRYAVQLDTLRSMGFTDTAQCIRALETVGGNLNRAIDLLLAQQQAPRP